MWGSSFAEIAKKAQEQANSLSIQSPVTELFNLDGLQSSDSNDNDESKDNSESEIAAADEAEEKGKNLMDEMKAESKEPSSIMNSAGMGMGIDSLLQSFSTSKLSEYVTSASSTNDSESPQLKSAEANDMHEQETTKKEESSPSKTKPNSEVKSTIEDTEVEKKEETTEIATPVNMNDTEETLEDEEINKDNNIVVDTKIMDHNDDNTNDNLDEIEANDTAADDTMESTPAKPEPEPKQTETTTLKKEEDLSVNADNENENENDELNDSNTTPEISTSGTLSSIETPPMTMSPSVKTMIDSTNKMFGSSSLERQKNGSLSELSGNDGLEEEEQNLESLSKQLAMEVEAEVLPEEGEDEDEDDELEVDVKVEEPMVEGEDNLSENDDPILNDEEKNNDTIDDNINSTDDSSDEEENNGWTNVDVDMEKDEGAESTKILESIDSLNDNIIDNEASLPLSSHNDTDVDADADVDRNHEEDLDVDIDESSPHSSEVMVDPPSIGNEILDEEEDHEYNNPLEESKDINTNEYISSPVAEITNATEKETAFTPSTETTPSEISVTHSHMEQMEEDEKENAISEDPIEETAVKENPPPPPPQKPPSNEIPQDALEKFMEQLQRLDENHQHEIKELQKKHELQLQEALARGDHAGDAVEQLEQYALQMKELKTILLEKEKERQTSEDLIFDLRRKVEAAGFKYEELQKQVGTQVQSSEKQTVQLSNEIRSLQNEIKEKEASNQELQSELSNAKAATAASADQYVALKTRVKSVATELKERRGECRKFYEKVSNLEAQTSHLTAENTKLTAQLTEVQGMYEEKDSSVKDLRLEVVKLTSDLKNAKTKKQKNDQKGDNALKSYKVKAQNALAAANARAATAIQAKEEMMIEWQGTKQATLDAEKKARMAQTEKGEAEKKAKEAISDMEKEVEECYVKMSEMEKRVEEAEEKASELEKEIQVSTTEQHKIFDEMEKMEIDMEKEKQSNSELHTKYVEEKQTAEQLMKEVLELREVQKRTSTEAFMAKKKEQDDMQTSEQSERPSAVRPSTRTTTNPSSRKNEAEGTITMLHEELIEANETISELKEALRMVSLEKTLDATTSNFENEMSDSPMQNNAAYAFGPDMDNFNSSMKPGNSNSETPLFYALEKQAELNIARDEINRLANVLGDAEAAKMEALEQREEWKKRMEMAEAKVQRQEKFAETAQEKNTGMSILVDPTNKGENVNLEYLKNVILQYLNATTVAQRKSLIPVVGAVLCLTSDEQKEAVKALEYSSGLQSVGTSLIEGLETSLFGLSGTSGGRNTSRRENARPERPRRERRR